MRPAWFLLSMLTVGALAPTAFGETPASVTVVTISQFAFLPSEVTVKRGATIRFENKDFAPHSATSDDMSFDSQTLRKDEISNIIAGRPGIYVYHCKFHPGMVGRITIE